LHTELKVAVRTCEGKAMHRMTQNFHLWDLYYSNNFIFIELETFAGQQYL
jgi:hypothetical protein